MASYEPVRTSHWSRDSLLFSYRTSLRRSKCIGLSTVLQIHDNSRETTDMTIYRLAESKAVNIGQIERLLKESSIDCTIMNVSKPTGLKRKVRPPFQRAELVEVSLDDNPYSKICSYSDTCTYECNSTSYLETKNLDTLDVKSFKPVLYQLCDQIKQLFQQIYSIDCNQLIRWVREQGIECTEDVIYFSDECIYF